MAKLQASLKSGYIVTNSSRDHLWIADEPEDLGGSDKGPTPSELLLSSLASCKLITVQMYAKRKAWNLEGVDIELSILEKGEKTLIEKAISFKGDLDDKQRERLLDISGRCPVVKMLANSIEFKLV